MRYDLAVFDLDGTLLDTLDDLTVALNIALEANGFATRSREEVCSFVGDGLAALMRRGAPETATTSQVQSVFDAFKAYYAHHSADLTHPYAGVVDMLKTLSQMGMPCAVVTNKAQGAAVALCKTFFDGLLISVQGDEPPKPRKPAPDGIYALMERLGLTKDRVAFIGDSQVDVATAQNAGVDGILVTWGFRTAEQLKEAGAQILCDTPEQVIQTLIGE